ncbi:response regulator [Wenzhouxiangella marina]|uniref:Hisitidine kinase n=1 Tax=Wenzhouxiangella marina TaxID=1579979 RepID=A0A0K0XVC6_9GAMM|nr:response regulator transcription factor [Wenzhouxiangella marina]AKS41633.1 hisitidine kinase [Wenzhouxiangella marina]MBB6086607.1 DNA-binding NarL/FixJ family response regulator [Wenzhouxiangella marina]
MNKALIIEDLPAARAWLEAALNEAFPGISVACTESCSGAREWLAQDRPDLALVDLGLPDGDGTALIAAIKRAHPDALCVVASTFADDAHLFPALRAGADGYFTKDQGQDALVRVLREISQGKPPLSPGIARRLLSFFQDPEPPETPLSPRETEVLQLIGKGYSLNEVGRLLEITRHTAAGYVKDIYRKLGINSRAEAALKAAEFGLLR